MPPISLTEKPDVKWEECAGLQEVKDLLKEATRRPGVFCRSVTLFGPPGTGKSLIVNAAVSDAKESNYIWVSAYELRYDSDVKSLFNVAKTNAPCIVYIDDVDALCDPDGSGRFSEEMGPAKAELIARVGGAIADDGILAIGASNKPWRIQSDLLDAFEKKIYIPLPDITTRAMIFHRNMPPGAQIIDEDIRMLSEKTEGFTGADILTVLRDAQMEPIRKIQNATHFKKVESEKFTPCLPDSSGATEMDWTQVPADSLLEPNINMTYIKGALQRARPSVEQDEVKRFQAFADRYGF